MKSSLIAVASTAVALSLSAQAEDSLEDDPPLASEVLVVCFPSSVGPPYLYDAVTT